MLTIRLQRRGRKNDPSFRVIVVESTKGPKTGSFLETLGNYDPRTDRVELNEERAKHWLTQGAQTSGTVHNLFVSKKLINAKKINVLPKKTAPKPAPTEASAKEPAVEVAPVAVAEEPVKVDNAVEEAEANA